MAKDRFSIDCDEVEFVSIPFSDSMHAYNYPFLTLAFQIIAFILVSFHAVYTYPCDVFVDTLGVAVAYVFVKMFFGCKIVSYTHYPMIQHDMLD